VRVLACELGAKAWQVVVMVDLDAAEPKRIIAGTDRSMLAARVSVVVRCPSNEVGDAVVVGTERIREPAHTSFDRRGEKFARPTELVEHAGVGKCPQVSV